MAPGSPPGLLRRAFYCDESGIASNQRHYGFGALIMKYQRRGEFAADVAVIRARYPHLDDEVKWTKCSRANLPLYKELVDYVFKSSSLAFHCMVVERAWVKTHLYHEGSYDLARRKHLTTFLSNKISAISKANGRRPLWVRVYVDELPSSYAKAGETIEIVGNHVVNQSVPLGAIVKPGKTIDSVIECDSKEYIGIQICDLILGAVVDTWNEGSTNSYKAELKQHIAAYLGWSDLKSDTRPDERKFNVWWLTDQIRPGDVRPVDTRDVVLLHPLPVPRIYESRPRPKK